MTGATTQTGGASRPFARILWLSFTAASLVLYLAGCLIIVALQHREIRVDLHYLLYSEAESLASYFAATGKLDFPELVELEDDTPAPIWLRVVEGDRILAATPGLAELPAQPFGGERWGDLRIVRTPDGETLTAVVHGVWNQPQVQVQAFSRKILIDTRMARLIRSLLLTGLILVPVSALLGRWLAALLLRPVERLMSSLAVMAPEDLSRRLEIGGRIREIDDLAREFNELLGRVESTVQRMQRFTANASHELRTPIASLRTGIEVCLRRPRSEEEYREVLEDSLREIRRMHRSVEGLLTLAREREGQTIRALGPIDLSDVARTAFAAVQPLLEEKNLTAKLSLRPAPLVGDAGMLELMIVNLLDNAIRFSPRGSAVRLSIQKKADGVGRCVLRVADDGPGVSPADGERIFARHYQGEGSGGGDLPASARVGGIGLDLVRWVVEAHRGVVRLVDPSATAGQDESEEKSVGACFEIELPCGGQSG